MTKYAAKEYASLRIGEVVMQHCGIPATITEYINSRNVKIRFATEEERWCSYGNFKRGFLSPVKPGNLKKIREGEITRAHNGQMMTIKEYICSDYMVVEFEDDTLVYGVKYTSFQNGHVKNPNFKTKRIAKEKKNEQY